MPFEPTDRLALGRTGLRVTRLGFGAASIGGLRIPPSWTAAAPTVRLVAATSPTTSISAAPTVAPGGLFSDMALTNMAGQAMATSAPRHRPGATSAVIKPNYGVPVARQIENCDSAAVMRFYRLFATTC